MIGYLKTYRSISEAEAKRIRNAWMNAQKTGEIVILGKDMDYVELNQFAHSPVTVRCGHCGQWAASQTECKHCGATVL